VRLRAVLDLDTQVQPLCCARSPALEGELEVRASPFASGTEKPPLRVDPVGPGRLVLRQQLVKCNRALALIVD